MVTARIQAGTQLRFWRFKMTEEKRPTVVEMLRTTGMNTAEFMDKVAAHIEGLEQEVIRLKQRVQEMELSNDNSK